jgi:hypothetical protein
MTGLEENRATIEALGYRLIMGFENSPNEWTTGYHDVIAQKPPAMKARHMDDSVTIEVIADHRREIEMFEE